METSVDTTIATTFWNLGFRALKTCATIRARPPWATRVLTLVAINMAMSGCLPDFGHFDEVTGLSYSEYAAKYPASHISLVPNGASKISYRSSGGRDGYDEWAKFTMTPSEFEPLVLSIARTDHGPEELNFIPDAVPPSTWKPDLEQPTWWQVAGGSNPQSTHWCFSAGAAERHHGYFFVLNAELKTVWCWHWNHQWSSTQCTGF